MFHGRISLNTSSGAASEFCEWVQVRIDACISHCKYEVKPHSSSWFLVVRAAAIVHRNHFFCLYQQSKSSESKIQFRQTINLCKKVLEAGKLAYANKAKESITSQNLCRRDFWRTANILCVLSKSKSPINPLFHSPVVLSSAYNKAKLFGKGFSKNSNLEDLGISLPPFSSRTNLKLHSISATPKMVKKVIANLDSSKASGSDCILIVALKNCVPELSYLLGGLFLMCLKESCFPDC